MERIGRLGEFQWRCRRGSLVSIIGWTRGNKPDGSVYSTICVRVSFVSILRYSVCSRTGHTAGACLWGCVHFARALPETQRTAFAGQWHPG